MSEIINEVNKSSGSRLEKSWLEKPNLPDSHYVDSAIYTSQAIFDEEMDKVWKNSWLPICHESELPNALDFRSLGTFSNTPLVAVRGGDLKIRVFLNICPHRGNKIVRAPSGNLGVPEPSGNPKNMTCMFHGWQFNAQGKCVEIPREKNGYQDRVCKGDLGLREIRSEVGYGGFVWISMKDQGETLDEFLSGCFDFMKMELDTEPLEVFHYQKSLIKANYKLWHETSREFYHDYLHYHNRATGMLKPGYFDRRYTPFPHGHAATGLTTITYEGYEGSKDRFLTFPGMPKNGWKQLNIFPACTYSLRASCLRVSIMTPISPNEVLIELRGLGLKSDSPTEREERITDHDTIWGPFGRNLHEDLLVVEQQQVAMQPGSGSKYLLMAREEDNTIHDEIGLRSYYQEWERLMGRSASKP